MKQREIDVYYIETLNEAKGVIEQHEYCLAILNLQQLDAASISFLHMMRQIKPIPILAITESMKLDEKIALFRSGVHAHLQRPIEAELCIAQADALVQLYYIMAAQKKTDKLSFGNKLIIKYHFRQVFVQGRLLALTRKEFDLLSFLAQNPWQVFSYEQLYAHIWNDEYVFGAENTVRVHIVTLRKKLSGMKENCIQNVWGIGYRFVPPSLEMGDT